jgi:hypothetical protein
MVTASVATSGIPRVTRYDSLRFDGTFRDVDVATGNALIAPIATDWKIVVVHNWLGEVRKRLKR